MKKFLMVLLALTVVGCSSDKVTLPDHNGRITELERRADLNDQLDSAQSLLIQANADAIAAETAARIAADQDLEASLQQEIQDRAAADSVLQGLLNDEAAARQAGDDSLAEQLQLEIANRIAGDQQNSQALATAVFVQSLTNVAVQIQLGLINNKITQLTNKTNSLQSQVNNINNDINALEASVQSLNNDLNTLESYLQSQIDSLSMQQSATQAQLDQEGVKVYKCNAASSTERMFKINGTFYGVMNRVTTEQVQVITGSSSTSFTNPVLCLKDDKAKLPGGNGQCPSSWTTVGGNTVNVSAYSTATKTVVTSVKMAMDPFSNGSYITTDGGPACSFSINNGVATNLVQVQ
jgi:archaellum component FlaC